MRNQENYVRVKAMDYVRALAIIFMVFTHELGLLMGLDFYDSNPISRLFEDTMGITVYNLQPKNVLEKAFIESVLIYFNEEKKKASGKSNA